MLSVVMITKNAEHLLRRTLRSVSWADSILIVDSGSTDGTCQLAERLGAQVLLQTDWKGYGHQKAFALSQAKGDWILFLDADEVVDPSLANEIQQAIELDQHFAGYSFRRINYFATRRLRYGNGRPHYVDRLFRRGKGLVSNHRVHERIIINGPIKKLQGELHHYSTESIRHRIQKNEIYATIAAEDLFHQGKHTSILQLLFLMPLSVFHDLIIKKGLLDGKVGIIMAITGAFYSFSKYAKLWELERQQKH